jgi:hypothetical protein
MTRFRQILARKQSKASALALKIKHVDHTIFSSKRRS